jgi:hypothetical protein
MNIFKEFYQIYKMIKHRNRLVNININDLIRSNFESACSIFRGFFGEPAIDNDLFVAYKHVRNESLKRKITDFNYIAQSFGFELFTSKPNDGLSMKVQMIPRSDIRSYLTDRSLGKDSKVMIHLYKSLSGNVI